MTRALLLMDFEPAILASVGGDDAPALANAVTAADAARQAGIDVIFVRVAFRPGFPEVNPNNKAIAAATGRAGEALYESAPTTQIHAKLAPRDDEPVIVKRRFGAFASDLAEVLRGKGVDSLVLGGVSTSGVVLSTLRPAADLDFELTVLSDACADRDEEAHSVLLNKIFPAQADVVTTAEWVASL